MTNKILRLAQIEERTGVKVATLRYLRHLGRGPATFKLAGRVVAYEHDVDAWIEQERTADRRSGGAA